MARDHLGIRHHRDIHQIRKRIQEHPQGTGISTNEFADEQSTRGERMADRITSLVGSWRFIITQSITLGLWLVVNSIGWYLRWDPYPFILLNLVLSFQAAFTAPIIMMSQNRQTARDRIASELNYEVNRAAALEVDEIKARLDDLSERQWATLMENLAEHSLLLERIHELAHRTEQRLTAADSDEHPV